MFGGDADGVMSAGGSGRVSDGCRAELLHGDDLVGETAALLREHLRVPGMGETTARYFRDKLAMRVRARNQGILVPDFVAVVNDDAINRFADNVALPWMLKPRSNAAAIGIHRIEKRDDLWPTIDGLGDQRSFYVLEQYFNLNFQFYGRQLKFFCVQPEGGSIAQEQAAAALADSYGVYGAMFASTVGCAEYTRMKMVSICEGLQDGQYAEASPYKWASFETETMQDEMVVEYVCKKLAGKKADYAGSPDLQSRQRKFGIITYDNRDFGGGVPLITKGIKACGGGDVKVVFATVGTDTAEGSAQLASAATQFQQDHVTTVIPLMDVIADFAAYPEWAKGVKQG